MATDWLMKLKPGTCSGALCFEVAELKDKCLSLLVASLSSLKRVRRVCQRMSLTQRKVESRNEEKKVLDEARYPKLFPYTIK